MGLQFSILLIYRNLLPPKDQFSCHLPLSLANLRTFGSKWKHDIKFTTVILHFLTQSMIIMADMVEFMKNLARMDVDMSAEERHLFSVGFKNTIGAKRASWRIICSHEQKVTTDRQTGVMIDAYKKKVEDELRKVCNEVLSIIAIHCLPLANAGENVVFFYKMYVQVP